MGGDYIKQVGGREQGKNREVKKGQVINKKGQIFTKH